MKKCFIYSGWLRTWDFCKKNHEQMLPAPDSVIHWNEHTKSILPYKTDIWGYSQHKQPEAIPVNTMCMWQNMFDAFQLAPKDCDVYVRNRYDIAFEKPVLIESVELNTIYIPVGNDYRDGYNDQFAYGNFDVMTKYFNVVNNAQMLFDSGHIFHSEYYVRLNLEYYGITVKRFEPRNKIINFYNETYISRN